MRDLITVERLVERNGEEIPIYVEGYVEFHIECDYGADRDGNRGIKKVFVDDVHSVSASDYDGDEIILTLPEIESSSELLVIEFLEG